MYIYLYLCLKERKWDFDNNLISSKPLEMVLVIKKKVSIFYNRFKCHLIFLFKILHAKHYVQYHIHSLDKVSQNF